MESLPYQLSSGYWQRGFGTDRTTASGYNAAPVPSLAPPSGNGVIPFGDQGSISPSHLELLFYGSGASSATFTFDFSIYGWRATNLGIGSPLWIPVQLITGTAAFTAGTGTNVGILGSDLYEDASGNLYYFATTLTAAGKWAAIVSGTGLVTDAVLTDPTDNANTGMLLCPSFGFRFLQVTLNNNSSSASCNFLYCRK